MAWSPYKERVINYVSRNPGCCKYDVASHCTRNPRRCPSKQYYIVNTALKNGWITGRMVGSKYELFVPEQTEDIPSSQIKIVFDNEGGFKIVSSEE